MRYTNGNTPMEKISLIKALNTNRNSGTFGIGTLYRQNNIVRTTFISYANSSENWMEGLAPKQLTLTETSVGMNNYIPLEFLKPKKLYQRSPLVNFGVENLLSSNIYFGRPFWCLNIYIATDL